MISTPLSTHSSVSKITFNSGHCFILLLRKAFNFPTHPVLISDSQATICGVAISQRISPGPVYLSFNPLLIALILRSAGTVVSVRPCVASSAKTTVWSSLGMRSLAASVLPPRLFEILGLPPPFVLCATAT